MQRIFDPVLKFFEQPEALIDLNDELNQLSANLAEKINTQNKALQKLLGKDKDHAEFLEETLPEWHHQLLTMNEYLRIYPSSYFLTNHQKIQAAQDAKLAYRLINAIIADPTMQKPKTQELLEQNPLLKIRNKHIRQGTFIVLAGLAVFAALIFLAISVSPMLPLFFFSAVKYLMLASLAVVPVGGYKYIQGEEHDACCEAITTTTPRFFGKQEQVLSTNQQKTEAKANERREQAEAFADAIERREAGTTAPSKSK